MRDGYTRFAFPRGGQIFVKLLIGGRRRAANVFYYARKDFLDFFFKRKEPIQVIKNF